MPVVRVKDNEPFDIALRRFKRSCEKAGILTEARRREFYEKPTAMRKRKAAAAVKRYQKKLAREADAPAAGVTSAATEGPARRPAPPFESGTPRLRPAANRRPASGWSSWIRSRNAYDRTPRRRCAPGTAPGSPPSGLVAAEIKQREVDGRQALDDAAVLAVLDRMRKQRREAAEQYAAAGRDELAAAERFEIEVIESYMPAPMTAEEVAARVAEAIEEAGASSLRDMGGVMARLRPRVQGRADMAEVSRLVRERLA